MHTAGTDFQITETFQQPPPSVSTKCFKFRNIYNWTLLYERLCYIHTFTTHAIYVPDIIYIILYVYLGELHCSRSILFLVCYVENNMRHDVYIRRNYSTHRDPPDYTFGADWKIDAAGTYIINDLCILGRTLYYTRLRITHRLLF